MQKSVWKTVPLVLLCRSYMLKATSMSYFGSQQRFWHSQEVDTFFIINTSYCVQRVFTCKGIHFSIQTLVTSARIREQANSFCHHFVMLIRWDFAWSWKSWGISYAQSNVYWHLIIGASHASLKIPQSSRSSPTFPGFQLDRLDFAREKGTRITLDHILLCSGGAQQQFHLQDINSPQHLAEWSEI